MSLTTVILYVIGIESQMKPGDIITNTKISDSNTLKTTVLGSERKETRLPFLHIKIPVVYMDYLRST